MCVLNSKIRTTKRGILAGAGGVGAVAGFILLDRG